MINITLVCNLGLSTSMVLKRMQESAKKRNLEVNIIAIPENELKKHINNTDLVLLGPQISYKLNTLQNQYENIKVAVINGTDYAMMNGEKVLNFALDILK